MTASQKTLSMFLAFLGLAAVITGASCKADDAEYAETIVAGGPDEFVEVRHVVLRGSNAVIGEKIAELAKRNGTRPRRSGDVILNRAKREYMAENYPVMYERMTGVASAYGLRIDDDSYDFSGLSQARFAGPGCSVIFLPKEHTKNKHSILSRNYDFTTGDIQGRRPRDGWLPVMARPILFELHPDRGYSSLSLCAFEYLGGVLDGINSQGLAVAIAAEEESVQKVGHEPSNEVGVHELMSMRYLLDACKNIEEAKQALLTLKHYYSFVPCHYIVADRSGDSFVFEFSPNRNRSHVIDGDGPQCITNHLVSHHGEVDGVPENDVGSSFFRYRSLIESAREKESFSIDEITAMSARVAVPPTSHGNEEYAPARTLWYARYDLDDRTLAVKFYLGEKVDPADDSKVVLEYSPVTEFRLEH
jgi:predicted choloylglycine hydrolase